LGYQSWKTRILINHISSFEEHVASVEANAIGAIAGGEDEEYVAVGCFIAARYGLTSGLSRVINPGTGVLIFLSTMIGMVASVKVRKSKRSSVRG
jgi:hypothetical protein